MKKIISLILIFTFIVTYFIPVLAAENRLLYFDHYTDYYLQFSNGNQVKTAVVMYNDIQTGKPYPAYCVEPNKDGVRRCG